MTAQPDVSIVVPTYNEGPNVAPLLERIASALSPYRWEVLFVDDSSDDTPERIRALSAPAGGAVRLIHRDVPTGGLGGAVVEGLREAAADLCVVMDGDLQHPPETIPLLIERARERGADVVVASRYVGEGTATGLAGVVRMLVSRTSTAVTRAMFPLRLRDCTDPMTGFFLVDRRRIDLARLRPRGFKILLEILARHPLAVSEVAFDFAERGGGESKATLRQGLLFLQQLAALRFGKVSGFALVGFVGAIANLLIMFGLTQLGVAYVVAAIVAAEATIIGNFLLQERFVFQDLLQNAAGRRSRFIKSFTFNNVEALVRIPILAFMVETWHMSSILAAGITLVAAFVVRYLYHALFVYAQRDEQPTRGVSVG